ACPEDCAYCPQSVRYDTGLAARSLMEVAAVRECAAAARAAGATRFCMGAAYRSPKARDLKVIAEMIRAVREAGLESCATLGKLPEHPESVPINRLVRVPGTPLADRPDVDPFDFVRTIAVARLLMPRAHVRLSAGRDDMSDELQALCFLAGANSIFYGERL